MAIVLNRLELDCYFGNNVVATYKREKKTDKELIVSRVCHHVQKSNCPCINRPRGYACVSSWRSLVIFLLRKLFRRDWGLRESHSQASCSCVCKKARRPLWESSMSLLRCSFWPKLASFGIICKLIAHPVYFISHKRKPWSHMDENQKKAKFKISLYFCNNQLLLVFTSSLILFLFVWFSFFFNRNRVLFSWVFLVFINNYYLLFPPKGRKKHHGCDGILGDQWGFRPHLPFPWSP